ncbi:MAG: hypothetical protein IIX30_04390, partial [Clostridia bacterium]|nr:hypothetical protein [Clostridia bacterium]
LICATLLALCLFLSFDKELGYFKQGALPSLFKAFYVISVAFMIFACYIYIKCKKISVESSVLPPFFKIICGSVGVLSAIYSVYGAITALTSHDTSFYTLASLLGALAFGGFLIFAALKDGFEYHGAKLALLCLSILFPIGITMKNVFYVYRPSNSVENTLCVIISVALLLYILTEGKRMISGVATRAYPLSLLLSFFSSATLSASYVASYIGGAVVEADRFKDMLLCLALSVYFACALLTFISTVKEKKDAEAEDEIKE